MCKVFLAGTQAPDRMHHITFQWIQWQNQGAWVPEFDIVGNTIPMVWLPYLSRLQNGLNGLSVIISSHFMIENVRLLQSQFFSIFIIFVHLRIATLTFTIHYFWNNWRWDKKIGMVIPTYVGNITANWHFIWIIFG